MKIYIKTLFLLLIFSVLSGTLLSQELLRVDESMVLHEKEQVPALLVTISPERKDLQKAFDDWMKDSYDVNMKGGGLFGDKNLRTAEGVVVSSITRDKINFFTKTITQGGETKMYMFASRGLQNYIRPSEVEAFDGMEVLFDDFLASYLPDYYQERVNEAVAALEDLRKDFGKAQKKYADNEEEILSLQEENLALESEMKALEASIKAAAKKVEQRRNTQGRVSEALRNN